MRLEKYTYDVRERWSEARAYEHPNPTKMLAFCVESEATKNVRFRRMQIERTKPEAVVTYCERFCSFKGQKIE